MNTRYQCDSTRSADKDADEDPLLSCKSHSGFVFPIQSDGQPNKSSSEIDQEVSDRRSVECTSGSEDSTLSLPQQSVRELANDDERGDRYHQNVYPTSSGIRIGQAPSLQRISTETPIPNQRNSKKGKAFSKLTVAIKNILESGDILDPRHAEEYNRYLKLKDCKRYEELEGKSINDATLSKQLKKDRQNQTRNMRNLLAGIFQAIAKGNQIQDLEGKLRRLKETDIKIEDIQQIINEQFKFCRDWLVELVEPGHRFFGLVFKLKHFKTITKMVILESIEVLQMMLRSNAVHCNSWIASKLEARGDFREIITELRQGRMSVQMAHSVVTCQYNERKHLLRKVKSSHINNISHFLKKLITKQLESLQTETEDEELKQAIRQALEIATDKPNKKNNDKMLKDDSIRKAFSSKYQDNGELLLARILSLEKVNLKMMSNLVDRFEKIKQDLTKPGLTLQYLTKREIILKRKLTKQGVIRRRITKQGIITRSMTKRSMTKRGITQRGVTKRGIAKH